MFLLIRQGVVVKIHQHLTTAGTSFEGLDPLIVPTCPDAYHSTLHIKHKRTNPKFSPWFCASRQDEGAVASGTFGYIVVIHVSPFAIRLMARLEQYLSQAFFQSLMGFPERSFQPRSVQSSHHSRASASESLAAAAKS